MSNVNREIAFEMLRQMPEEQKHSLKSQLERNFALTSSWIMEYGTLSIYKEGFYLQLEGTRSSFFLWAYDNDGEFVFTRKPKEKTLHKIYKDTFHFEEQDFMKL